MVGVREKLRVCVCHRVRAGRIGVAAGAATSEQRQQVMQTGHASAVERLLITPALGPCPAPESRCSLWCRACARPLRAPTPVAWPTAWAWMARATARLRRRRGRTGRMPCWRRPPAWTTTTGGLCRGMSALRVTGFEEMMGVGASSGGIAAFHSRHDPFAQSSPTAV